MLLFLLHMTLGLAQDTGATGVDNPHGRDDACLSCHEPADEAPEAEGAEAPDEDGDQAPDDESDEVPDEEGDEAYGETEVGPALPVVETCLGCHPTADMHPVEMAPVDVTVPDAFPLEEGEVTCATCHAEPAHGGEFAELEAPWHRGGPYDRITTFCYQCHEQDDYRRTDPHHPTEADEPRDPSCAACHSTAPEEGASVDQARLRLEPTEACSTCHTGDIHAGVEAHLGKQLEEGMPTELPESLTLYEGAIRCWTCHEVHDAGEAGHTGSRLSRSLREAALAGPWSDVPAEATWPGEETDKKHPPMLALPLQDGALCEACHGEGPR